MNYFDKALEIIRERGMCKFTQENSEGKVCLYGAIAYARQGHRGWYSSDPLMDKVAGELFPERCYSRHTAATVNNHPDTTQEDVELILKHCSYEYDLLHNAT